MMALSMFAPFALIGLPLGPFLGGVSRLFVSSLQGFASSQSLAPAVGGLDLRRVYRRR